MEHASRSRPSARRAVGEPSPIARHVAAHGGRSPIESGSNRAARPPRGQPARDFFTFLERQRRLPPSSLPRLEATTPAKEAAHEAAVALEAPCDRTQALASMPALPQLEPLLLSYTSIGSFRHPGHLPPTRWCADRLNPHRQPPRCSIPKFSELPVSRSRRKGRGGSESPVVRAIHSDLTLREMGGQSIALIALDHNHTVLDLGAAAERLAELSGQGLPRVVPGGIRFFFAICGARYTTESAGTRRMRPRSRADNAPFSTPRSGAYSGTLAHRWSHPPLHPSSALLQRCLQPRRWWSKNPSFPDD
jgi:hypothetical protein